MEISAHSTVQLGYAFRQFRKAQNLTQGDVGARCNLRVATISALENGEGGTKLSTILAVEGALDLEFRVATRD